MEARSRKLFPKIMSSKMFSFPKRFLRKKSLPERISPEEPFSRKTVLFPVFGFPDEKPLRWKLLYDIDLVEIAAETTLKFSCDDFSSKEEALLFSESLGREAIVLDFEITMGIFAKTGKLVNFWDWKAGEFLGLHHDDEHPVFSIT
jgi:hypothetical protein